MPLPCHCHVIAMTLPCHCRAIAMALPCHGHVIAMSLPRHCHVIAMSLPCHCHVMAMPLPCHCPKRPQVGPKSPQEAPRGPPQEAPPDAILGLDTPGGPLTPIRVCGALCRSEGCVRTEYFFMGALRRGPRGPKMASRWPQYGHTMAPRWPQ